MNGPVVLAVPPAPGSADPANLYVDLQSRALWLGVDPSVDPAGAVLISDIVALEAAIEAAEVDAKAYTDEQILTRAPVVHTHTASQIVDFEAAVEAVTSGGGSSGGFVVGMIMLWSGILTDIGIGLLADWHLCDGSTVGGKVLPDLREKFVVGAGVRQPGDTTKNPGYPQLTSFKTPAAEGTHAHTVGNTTLTLAQMPQHRHSVSVSGGTDSQGSHAHTFPIWSNSTDASGHVRQEGTASAGNKTTSTDGAHTHNVTASGTSEYQGSSGAHNHPLTGAGTHQHTVTQQNITQTIPWFALAYIIKIA